MNLKKPAKQIAIDISARSSCSVQVGSCIMDSKGRVFSTGWNSMGDGFGQCSEVHCIFRANRKRLEGSTLFVAGFRARTGNPVTSKPCRECQKIIRWSGIRQATYYTKEEGWENLYD